ncbi:hypothetical protein GZ77_13875 [Endozoicomonas montiporae]|uniref:Uncharacterized protein n=2 Tax=Endozoicomonas montiporae TaxID=1027273 RepID=A0A081N4T4_9GAMM|nr:hypothetical protein [Endozoicomonas montiporae]AMO57673.1 hypothetical protein EZMO1_3713 [Endozoicomonas montiporae CL-33]KEQ13457.1 hypothetical protein GZ77_13875 [Endozoicomonas montiporae]
MNPSKSSALETEVSELKVLVSNLLNKVNKLTTENTALREEIRHLKKLKGQPKIRPNKKGSEDGEDDKGNKGNKSAPDSGNSSPPKGKRPSSQPTGRTAKPSPSSIREEICPAENVQGDWLNKGWDYSPIARHGSGEIRSAYGPVCLRILSSYLHALLYYSSCSAL